VNALAEPVLLGSAVQAAAALAAGFAALIGSGGAIVSSPAPQRIFFRIGFDQALRPASSMTATRSQGLRLADNRHVYVSNRILGGSEWHSYRRSEASEGAYSC